MTLSARDPQRSFCDVSFLAENLFGDRNPYELFRREIRPALAAQRQRLGAMYCADNGRPPIDPVLVAGVTLLQFMEKAPDRQAIERLRLHLGWKHALGLAVDYAGFHPEDVPDTVALPVWERCILALSIQRSLWRPSPYDQCAGRRNGVAITE